MIFFLFQTLFHSIYWFLLLYAGDKEVGKSYIEIDQIMCEYIDCMI